MCWADRAGIAWAVFISAFLLMIGDPEASTQTTVLALLQASWPVWAILRLIDFALGGPRRRRVTAR